MLYRTFDNQAWSTIDDRAFTHEGIIVDLGCQDWYFTQCFNGKKRIVGADPQEVAIPGTEIFIGCVGSSTRRTILHGDGPAASTIFKETPQERVVEMLSWKDFVAKFSIGPISLLKMNIEGDECSLILSMDNHDLSQIDQMAISFHDWTNQGIASITEKAKNHLIAHGFEIIPTHPVWGWHMALKKT